MDLDIKPRNIGTHRDIKIIPSIAQPFRPEEIEERRLLGRNLKDSVMHPKK